jgi:GNAT superfamily N-acetyltransferase
MKILIKEMRPHLWDDLERLFGEKGACGGCWCMWWRIEKGEKWENIKGAEAKKRFRTMIQNGTVRGLMAYDGTQPIGWCTFGKRTDFPKLNRARTLQCEDGDQVSCVPCFYVRSNYRKKGISAELLKAAVQTLAKEGETAVEGYPVKPSKPGNKNIPAVFAFTGTIPIFEKQGFVLAGSRSTSKLRYRKILDV